MTDLVVVEHPERIRLSRRAGWRLPEGAMSVARPTKWGNPFKVGDQHEEMDWVRGEMVPITLTTVAQCVRAFQESIGRGSTFEQDVKRELRGHHLACWCPLGSPCHADVLLAIANA